MLNAPRGGGDPAPRTHEAFPAGVAPSDSPSVKGGDGFVVKRVNHLHSTYIWDVAAARCVATALRSGAMISSRKRQK